MKFFRKVDEDNKRNMVEGFKDLQTLWGKKEGFYQTPVQEIISGKKYLSHGRSASFEKFEDYDK